MSKSGHPGGATDNVTIDVGVGEFAVSAVGTLATHALGSCVALCLWDHRVHVGGLLHFMLPTASGSRQRLDRPAMFADQGLRLLLRAMANAGARRPSVGARLVGGASIAGTSVFAVGKRNVVAARKGLVAVGIQIQSEDVGDRVARTVRMRMSDGEIRVTSPGRPDLFLPGTLLSSGIRSANADRSCG